MEWVSVKNKLPDCTKVLAICVSEKNTFYNMTHDGWFTDTIYACWVDDEKFIIESHGPILPATHWMPLPPSPKDEDLHNFFGTKVIITQNVVLKCCGKSAFDCECENE